MGAFKRIIAVSFLAAVFGQSSIAHSQNLNGLTIHPDNPYFLFFNGKFILSWANNNHGAPHGTMAEHKVNHYEIVHRWFDGEAVMLAGNRFPENGSINFNEDYFAELRSELMTARNNGIAVTIVLYSGPAFEGDRDPGSRFGQNAWNACLGGPIDIGSCPYQESGNKSSGGLKSFLNLESFDHSQPLTSQYETYAQNWPVPRKIQYRQEEIINKFMQELGDLDNWMFNVMWEIDDQSQGDWDKAKEWANWFAGYVHHNFDDKRLVMTGEVYPSAELQSRYSADFYADIASQINGSQHEGIVSWGGGPFTNLSHMGKNDNRKPKVVIGYDPWNCQGQISDKLCNEGSGCLGVEELIEFIRGALLTENGIHPATPFHFARCGDGKETVLDYIKALQDFLETVDSWHNEPGDEIDDSTLPHSDDFGFTDLPDGDGRKGWPRHNSGGDNDAPSQPKNVKVEINQ